MSELEVSNIEEQKSSPNPDLVGQDGIQEHPLDEFDERFVKAAKAYHRKTEISADELNQLKRHVGAFAELRGISIGCALDRLFNQPSASGTRSILNSNIRAVLFTMSERGVRWCTSEEVRHALAKEHGYEPKCSKGVGDALGFGVGESLGLLAKISARSKSWQIPCPREFLDWYEGKVPVLPPRYYGNDFERIFERAAGKKNSRFFKLQTQLYRAEIETYKAGRN